MAPPPIPVVVDVVVTRGNVLGPAGYSRVTTKDGGAFDLHRGKDDKSTDISDDAAFLWCRRGAPGETAITSVVRGALEKVQVVDLGDGAAALISEGSWSRSHRGIDGRLQGRGRW